MTKRPSLVAGMKAARDQVKGKGGGGKSARPSSVAGDVTENGVTTAIHIYREQLELLKDVAHYRQRTKGGRSSVSDIVRGLIEGDETAEGLRRDRDAFRKMVAGG